MKVSKKADLHTVYEDDVFTLAVPEACQCVTTKVNVIKSRTEGEKKGGKLRRSSFMFGAAELRSPAFTRL
jgi:hypothetical protein